MSNPTQDSARSLFIISTWFFFPMVANIANRDQSSSYISQVIGNHPTSTGLSIAKHHSILHLIRIHRILSGQGKDIMQQLVPTNSYT